MKKIPLLLAALAAPLAAPLAAQNAPSQFDMTRTVPLTPGQWSYAATAAGSDAAFAGRFVIHCDRNARRVTLRRMEPSLTVTVAAMTITTDLAMRTLPADGVVANTDRVLDAIAFSRGRFIVTGGGGSGSRLVLPASAEAARSIEDCRI